MPILLSLFRQYGYDGTSLAKISEATGLGKASLYHHFPGGKDAMMEAVLDYADDWVNKNVLTPLASGGSAAERLQNMCDRINALYGGGTQPCLLGILQTGTGRDIFHSKVKAVLERWIEAIATVLVESGIAPPLAQQQGEHAIILIQGALVASQGLDKPDLFQHVIQALPHNLMTIDLKDGKLLSQDAA